MLMFGLVPSVDLFTDVIVMKVVDQVLICLLT